MNAPFCEARRCSAQTAMAQAKQAAHTEAADEAADGASDKTVGVSWPVGVAMQSRNTAQDQHSKASGSCSVFATRSFAGTVRIASPF